MNITNQEHYPPKKDNKNKKNSYKDSRVKKSKLIDDNNIRKTIKD